MPIQVVGADKFAAHCVGVGKELRKTDDAVVLEMSKKAKGGIVQVASAKHLSRYGRGNNGKNRGKVKLSAGYQRFGPGVYLVRGRPAGMWGLFEKGASEHPIGKSGTFLGNPALGFAAVGPVEHPATAPRPVWPAAKTRGVQVARSGMNGYKAVYVRTIEGT